MAEILIDKVRTGYQVLVRTGTAPDQVMHFRSHELAREYADEVQVNNPGSTINDSTQGRTTGQPR
jgi:hypothetical protein